MNIIRKCKNPCDFLKYYRSLSQLRKNAISGTVFALVNFALLILTYPIFISVLGMDLYGLWATLSVVVTFSQLGNVGINKAIMRAVSYEKGRNSYSSITSNLTTGIYFLTVLSGAVIVLLFFFRGLIANFLNPGGEHLSTASSLIPMIGLLSALIFMMNFFKGSLNGLGRMDLTNYIFLGSRIFGFLVSIFFLFLGLGIWSLLYGSLITHVVAGMIFVYLIAIPYRVKIFSIFAFRKSALKGLLSMGGTLAAGNLLHMLLIPFNKIIISRYIGYSEVTIFEVSQKAVMTLRSVFERAMLALMPRVSELQGRFKDHMKKIMHIHRKAMYYIIFTSGPVFLAVFIAGRFILELWLGSDFDPAMAFGLRTLLLGYFINLLCVPAFYIFMGIDKYGVCFQNIFIQSSINFIAVTLLLLLDYQISVEIIFVIFSLSIAVAAIYVLVRYHLMRAEYFGGKPYVHD